MLEMIASVTGFIILLSLFIIGALGSLLWQKNNQLSNYWNGFFATLGSTWGLLFVFAVASTDYNLNFTLGTIISPLLSVSFNIDALSIFFVFVISFISLFCSIYGLGYIKHYYNKYNIGLLGFLYNIFILGMLLIVTTDNGFFFLIVWEVMSVVSYFLVSYEHKDPENIKAGFLYLVMTHIGTAFIILAFILFYKFTGSFNFTAIKSGMILIPDFIKDAIFVFILIGFGTKAGIIPLHIWLPSAHPAAPSHVSALMSGVMIKTGIYMMIRIFLEVLQPVPVWWGLVVLIIGAISSLLGVLYALTEHDIKRLLAYHSIENIGIIMMGLGSAMTFYSLGMPGLALLGLVASLFHTLNHAIFKSLLFLSAGSVINQTHTRNMEEYGGLIKYMPLTALFFLIGSMAISALPPFNGFFSEWITFQALFQGISVLDDSTKWIFILAAGSLAFTGGLALACFVKVFGITFLARPRSVEIKQAKESTLSLKIGMGFLAGISLLFGIFSSFVISMIEKIGHSFTIFKDIESLITTSNQGLQFGNIGSVSGFIMFIWLVGICMIIYLITKYVIYKKQKIQSGLTWDCGVNLTPRMEITATGFARSILIIFKNILRSDMECKTQYIDESKKYLIKSRHVSMEIKDIFKVYFYNPFEKIVNFISQSSKSVQSGNINVYILYIFIALLLALFFIK